MTGRTYVVSSCRLWGCDDCAFAFDEMFSNGAATVCPNCTSERLAAENEQLRAALANALEDAKKGLATIEWLRECEKTVEKSTQNNGEIESKGPGAP